MKLYNPTDNDLAIVYLGIEYSVGPKSYTEDLKDEVAERWLATHEFLTSSEEVEKEPVEKATKKTTKDK